MDRDRVSSLPTLPPILMQRDVTQAGLTISFCLYRGGADVPVACRFYSSKRIGHAIIRPFLKFDVEQILLAFVLDKQQFIRDTFFPHKL